MPVDVDVIVVGSGFGGAVCACRLAAAGLRVTVLERGRRWRVEDYPRRPHDPWLWDQDHPERDHGWFDFRAFPNMTVVQGAGVGGGSLVYANISVEAKAEIFQSGWPPEIRFDTLAGHYATVGGMLALETVPAAQWPERTRLLHDGAERAGFGDRFRQLELAVKFDPDWSYDLPDAHDRRHSVSRPNAHGREQGTCIHLGNCVIGCDVQAKNTLDLNYLAAAEARGAEIRPLHVVRHLAPVPGGYEVHFDEIVDGTLRPGRLTSTIVILAAGSLGSTEILLRSRSLGTMPDLSARLGKNWSSNGDFLTPALHAFRNVAPTRGPTITAAIDLLDGVHQGQPIFVEDGGFPDLTREYLQELASEEPQDPRLQRLVATLLPFVTNLDLFRRVMPWFAQARDAADGTLELRDGKLHLRWDVRASEAVMNAVASVHRKLAFVTEGLPFTPLTWTIGRDLITPHPLGGCAMGTSPADGVVTHKGQVFGYPNLYVADGAVVPKAIGVNPSRTIAALAEHIAAELLRDLGR